GGSNTTPGGGGSNTTPGDGGNDTTPGGGGSNAAPDDTVEEPDDIEVPGDVAVPKDIYVTKSLDTIIGAGLYSYVPYLIENGKSTLIKWCGIVGNTVVFKIPEDGIYEYRDNKKVFNDISGHWAENTITAITSREIFSGLGEAKFDPNGGMTRAMFATVLARIDEADLSKYKTSAFKDVSINDWYGATVAWANDKGILSGYGDGVFAPNEFITREQMAVMLNNYLKYKGITLPSNESITSFADIEQVSVWAKDSVTEMKRMGLIQGSGNNNYLPKATANRASVAQIFMNVINAVVVNSNK
ncbi:MAG: S-layer homology domain-containing protein, partial [Clostridiaceae bacterium]|nr:S-layer homology domain-containing protein [Clostridiaceae bacterium]